MSPPEKEAAPWTRAATHHSTTATPQIAKPPRAGKGFVAKAAAGKVRPEVREPDRSHYMCGCCRWSA
jgi:hypothetical protein